MENFEALTNEAVRQKFKSQFELVNYAIKLADQLIKSGRSPRVEVDNQNPAVIIIEEIEEGEDQYEDVVIEPKKPEPAVEKIKDTSENGAPVKIHEKKKARRILA